MGYQAREHVRDQELECAFRKLDVTNEDSVNETVREVARTLGGSDILLCFVDIMESKLAVEYLIGSWRRIFDFNIHGSLLVARALARSLPSSPLWFYIP